jgi:Bacterial Ig-like domain (group 3)/FG-GAP-like repeat/MBG domain (YGX type)
MVPMFTVFHFSASLPCKSSTQPSRTLIIPHSNDSHQLLRRRSNKPKIIAALLLFVAGFATSVTAYASSPTTTTLQATGAGGSLPSGSVITLTATVVSGATAVTPGTVNFCDISLNTNCTAMTAIGSAQLTSTGIASIKTQLGAGAHSLVAVFAGTNLYTTSTSAASSLTITGAASYPTTTSLSYTAGTLPGSYNLIATVAGMGSSGAPAPTGTVNFLNTSNGNAILASASLQAMPGESTLSFGSPLPVPSSNYTTLVADINGDGKLDLITSVTNGTSASVLLGNGDGTFQALSAFTVPATSGLALGDFNNDGKLDLLAMPSNQNASSPGPVSVMFGNGDGTFQPPIASASVSGAGYTYVADVNGDGNLDMIAECAGCDVSVSLGNGDGTFQSPVTTSLPAPVYLPIEIGDFNHDGKIDLVILSQTQSGNPSVSLLIGNGDGTFQSPTAVTGPDAVVESFAEGDFNGDGNIDIAAVLQSNQTHYISVFLGNGDGTFQAPIEYPNSGSAFVVAHDFNGDGKVDLLYSNPVSSTLSLLAGKGDGTFQPTPFSMPLSSFPYLVADFNGDGKPDWLTSTTSLTLQVLLNASGPIATATATGISIPASEAQLVLASYLGDPANGTSASSTVSVPGSGAPITWPPPTQITYGTALSATQLNATSPAQGTFVYSPAVGTILSAGTQTLSVSFTPNNASGYTPSSKTVSITVNQVPVVLTVNNTARVYGTANPTFTGTITGAINGDALTETFSTTATLASIAGTYPIVPSFTGSAAASYYPGRTNGVLTVSQAGSTTTIALSNNNTTLTATVAALTSGSPTGNVGFYEGQTLVGTSPVVGGVASFTTSSAPAGNSIITAQYSGDPNFTQSASPATQILGVSPASTSLTVSQGGTVTDTIRIAPAAGTVGTLQLSCSGLPQASTCSFQPATITLGAANTPTSVVLTIQTGTSSTASLQTPQQNRRDNLPLALAAIFWIPGGIAVAIRPGKVKGSSNHRLLLLLALLIGFGGMTACSGGGSPSSSNSSTPKGVSTVQVMAAGAGNLTQTVSLTLNVQ